MAYLYHGKVKTSMRKYNNRVEAGSLNLLLIKVLETYHSLSFEERDTFKVDVSYRTHKGCFEDFYETVGSYNHSEVLDIVINDKVKRLQTKNKLGFRIKKYYSVLNIIAENKNGDKGVLYVFLIKDSHLDLFKNSIKYLKEEDKFIVENEKRGINWTFNGAFDYEMDEVQLPSIIRLF